jgi:hypothetical protein
MSKMNHEEKDSFIACGIVQEEFEVKEKALLDELNEGDDTRVSVITEAIEKHLTPREISFVLAQQMLLQVHTPPNPLREMLESFKASLDSSGEKTGVTED